MKKCSNFLLKKSPTYLALGIPAILILLPQFMVLARKVNYIIAVERTKMDTITLKARGAETKEPLPYILHRKSFRGVKGAVSFSRVRDTVPVRVKIGGTALNTVT